MKVGQVARVIRPNVRQRRQTTLSIVVCRRVSVIGTTSEARVPSAKQILQTIIAGAQSI
jgi:hypothetical protein